jgi:hypothetical protein
MMKRSMGCYTLAGRHRYIPVKVTTSPEDRSNTWNSSRVLVYRTVGVGDAFIFPDSIEIGRVDPEISDDDADDDGCLDSDDWIPPVPCVACIPT